MSLVSSYTDAKVDELIAPLVTGASIAGDGTLTFTRQDGSTIVIGTVQQLNDALTAIAGLSPAANDILQFVSGNWANRTPAQVLSSLSSNLSTIAGLTLTDGDILQRVSGAWVRRALFTPYKASAAANRTTTTLAIDPDLQVTLAASKVYYVRFSIIYAGTGGMGISWTTPAGVGGGYTIDYGQFGVSDTHASFVWTATPTAVATTESSFTGEGILTSGSGGTFGLNWGAHTATDAVNLGAGSLMEIREIG